MAHWVPGTSRESIAETGIPRHREPFTMGLSGPPHAVLQ